MRIAAISHRTPSRVVTNDEIIEAIEQESSSSFEGSLDETLAELTNLFERSGIETRHFLGADEPWYPHTREAIDEALAEANVAPDQIDCMIFCSVFKTMLEPSMACLIAKDIGARRAICYDVNEACAGWGRAVTIAQQSFALNTHQNVLIITAEANAGFDRYGSAIRAIKSKDDIEWAFPSATIGCAFTATLLSNEESPLGPSPWQIRCVTDNDLAHLCLFPQTWPKDSDFLIGETDTKGVSRGFFTCYGHEMQLLAAEQVKQFVIEDIAKLQAADWFIPHTQTYKPYAYMLDVLEVSQDKIFSIYPTHGNVVTSSLPASLSVAIENEHIERGDQVYMFMPASGLSLSSYAFTY